MTIDPDIMRLAEIFGPIALAAVGSVLTALVGGLAALTRVAWKAHQRRMAAMADALSELAKAVGGEREKVTAEHGRLWDAVQGVRAEIALASRNAAGAHGALLKLEGALERQIVRVDTYVERMGKVDSKLEALFRFVEAPRRATDAGR